MKIDRYYREIMFAIPAGAALVLFILATPFRWSDIGVAIIYFLIFNVIEYSLHRWMMHCPGALLFDHVRIHHRAWDAARAAGVRIRDRFVILPPYVLIIWAAVLLLGAAPIYAMFGAHAARLFRACGFAYYFIHEILHYSGHAGYLPWFSRHHLAHHDAPMKNYNFSFPVFDWLFGTKL